MPPRVPTATNAAFKSFKINKVCSLVTEKTETMTFAGSLMRNAPNYHRRFYSFQAVTWVQEGQIVALRFFGGTFVLLVCMLLIILIKTRRTSRRTRVQATPMSLVNLYDVLLEPSKKTGLGGHRTGLGRTYPTFVRMS